MLPANMLGVGAASCWGLRDDGKFELTMQRMESKHGGGWLNDVFNECKAQKQAHLHKEKTHFQSLFIQCSMKEKYWNTEYIFIFFFKCDERQCWSPQHDFKLTF